MAGDGRDLDDFVTTNAALAEMSRHYAEWAGDDGTVDADDLLDVADDTTGRDGADEREAALWLREGPHTFAMWESREVLTHSLVTRQVLPEHPDVAVSLLDAAAADPDAFLTDYTWTTDDHSTLEWLNVAVSSSPDPAHQVEMVLQFASIYKATAPDQIGFLDVLHALLDAVSFIDPFQVADEFGDDAALTVQRYLDGLQAVASETPTPTALRIAFHSSERGHVIPGIDDVAEYVDDVMASGPGVTATRGREMWWDEQRDVVVILDADGGGSAYVLEGGYPAFRKLVKE